jgi:hypothetical protein
MTSQGFVRRCVACGRWLSMVTPFQQATMEIQAGMVRNEIGVSYGLSGVSWRLLYVDRP